MTEADIRAILKNADNSPSPELIKELCALALWALEARETLKFYADNTTLDADDYDIETCDQGDFDHNEYIHGKHAREALAKYPGVK